MKKPQKFTLPQSIIQEIKSRAALYSLSASALIEAALDHLRESGNTKELVLSQVDNTHEMACVCYAVSESDFAFIKQLCLDTGVTKRIILIASVAILSKNFRAPSEK